MYYCCCNSTAFAAAAASTCYSVPATCYCLCACACNLLLPVCRCLKPAAACVPGPAPVCLQAADCQQQAALLLPGPNQATNLGRASLLYIKAAKQLITEGHGEAGMDKVEWGGRGGEGLLGGAGVR